MSSTVRLVSGVKRAATACSRRSDRAAASAGSRSASHSGVKSPIDALDGTRHQVRGVVPAAAAARARGGRRRPAAARSAGSSTTAESAVASAAASPGRHQQSGVRAHQIADGAGGRADHGQAARERLGHRHPVTFVPRGQHEDIGRVVAGVERRGRSSSPTNDDARLEPRRAHQRRAAPALHAGSRSQPAGAGEMPRRIGAAPPARASARRDPCAARAWPRTAAPRACGRRRAARLRRRIGAGLDDRDRAEAPRRRRSSVAAVARARHHDVRAARSARRSLASSAPRAPPASPVSSASGWCTSATSAAAPLRARFVGQRAERQAVDDDARASGSREPARAPRPARDSADGKRKVAGQLRARAPSSRGRSRPATISRS